MNMHKSMAFLYTHNKHTEEEIMSILPFTIYSRKINYLGINLTKNEKDLYSEKFKYLKKERERHKNARIWEEIPCFGIGRISTNYTKSNL